MTLLSGIQEGHMGYVLVADEWDPIGGGGALGTFVPGTDALKFENSTLDAVPKMVKRKTGAATRAFTRGRTTTKEQVGGGLMFGLYPTSGGLFLQKAIGKKVAVPAITADTTVSITTLGGISTLVLTAGGAYQQFQIVLIDTGAGMELRTVISYNVGTKTLVVAALSGAHTSAGTAVVAPAQDKLMPYTVIDAVGDLLGSISIEESVGGKYNERYAGAMVNKYNIKGAEAKTDVTTEVWCAAPRQLANGIGGNPAPTAFDPTFPSLAELSYEFTNGFLSFPLDQAATGTATNGLVDLGTNWELDINNNIKLQATFDGKPNLRPIPGGQDVSVKLDYINLSNHPVGYEFLEGNLGLPFNCQLEQNTGTLTSKKFQALSFGIPNLRYMKAAEDKQLESPVGEKIEGEAEPVSNQEQIYVFRLTTP